MTRKALVVTQPLVYAGSANVSVKPISGKYSWTTHTDYNKASDAARRSQVARQHGRHTRLLYRVNVYLKRKAGENN